MNKELYVSSTPHETKVALMEDDQLAEVFFERENEYTLAGSIYKGRVTRVLPGMQSAFVDIGLERDAFLYVSDFLEITGDEDEDDEFGEIPAPRGAIEVGRPQLQQEAQHAQGENVIAGAETEAEEPEFAVDFNVADSEQSAGEDGESAQGEDSGDGSRRWRGRRRRRGGRRGGRPDRPQNEAAPEPTEAAAPAPPAPRVEAPRLEPRNESRNESRSESRHESRPRQDYGPPAGYTPIILPGESISKYRNLSQVAAEPEASSAVEIDHDDVTSMPVEDFTAPGPEGAAEMVEEIQEEATHLDQGFVVAESEQAEAPASVEAEQVETASVVEEQQPRSKRGRFARWRRNAAPAEEAAPVEPVQQVEEPTVAATQSPEATAATHETAAGPVELNEAAVEDHRPVVENQQHENISEHAEVATHHEAHAGGEHEVDTPAGNFELPTPEQHAAPLTAPEGRTLEHEVLEEEEMDYHPVPDDVNAIREVAGDEELVLEEETLDAGNGYNDRWVPKIEDVDEDEIVAAEERGEQLFTDADSEEDEAEEEEEENGEEDETNGRAEVRAVTPTAGYQQRNPERPGYQRRGGRFDRDRGRRGGGGSGGGSRRNTRSRPNNSRNQPLISDLLKEGQEVLIQIAKEPIGKKGARITSHIALPGRFLVYMPTVNHVGVSRKINSDEERMRLKRIVTSERENGLGGFIVRTAAANIKEDELRADIRFLKHLWSEIKTRAENGKSPALIYHDLNLVERVLRDQVNADFSQIWVDTEDEYERVVRFASRFQPSLVRRIKLYTKETPLFEEFNIQDEINRSLKSKVWLKSGGHIVINQTEALVAIDVNTGKFVGKTQRLEDTIVKVNVDAIKEIVRQIRLRDLGGIIVIDFIDMDERKNRQKVMMALEDALRSDRAPSKVLQFNDFGLVAITRKRVKQSLERTLGESCPYCTGAGFVKSVPTVCNELYIEMRKMVRGHDGKDIMVRVHPEVAKALKANNGKLLTELEDLTGKTVLLKSDPALHQEMFDIH
ncbi:MAG TPA: Rne/Rng family ribonuclease [Terriglobales bacterium]|jgi:ribonuclease G